MKQKRKVQQRFWPPFQAIRGDRTGFMVLLEDRYGRPVWVLRTRFERYATR